MSQTRHWHGVSQVDRDSINLTDKIQFLKCYFKREQLVADLQWSLFVAAHSSYKRDTILRPFPPMFITEQTNIETDGRDYKALEQIIDGIPEFKKLSTDSLCQHLKSDLVTELLYWCLKMPNYTLKLCDTEKFIEIKEKTKQHMPTLSPHYIFEVIHSPENNKRFEQRCAGQDVLYGYHGSQIENFHSILNFGLQSHLSKNALFGEGTYLSSELAISLQYSPHGRGWEYSMLGDRLSCVAVCEMIDNPEWIKCQTKEGKKQLKRIGSRAKIAGSEGGQIPETYYVVRNNDAIRLKYLLLYVDRTPKRNQSWLRRHKFLIFITLYGLLLVLIALYNSKLFWVYVRRYSWR